MAANHDQTPSRMKGPGLPRALCIAMALQFAAGGAVLPFVTLVLRDRGLALSQVSWIFLVASGTLLFVPFLWGMLADRFVPLNRLFVLLNLGAAASLTVFAMADSYPVTLLSYTAYFAFLNPTLTLVNALAFHHLPDPREQFGVLRAWGSVGWIVPFLPISLWLAVGAGTSFAFVIPLGIGLCLAMALASFWIPHTPPGALHGSDRTVPRRDYFAAVKGLLRDPDYLVVLISYFLMSGSFSLLMYYSPPLLEDLGVARPWIGPIQAIGVLFEIVLFQWQRFLLRRWNYAATILVGCLALVLRQAIFSAVAPVWLLAASYLLVGVVIVFFYMGVAVLANSMASREVRATAQTMLVLASSGCGPMFANWAAGLIAVRSADSLRAIFIFATVLAVVASGLIALRGRRLNAIDRPVG